MQVRRQRGDRIHEFGHVYQVRVALGVKNERPLRIEQETVLSVLLMASQGRHAAPGFREPVAALLSTITVRKPHPAGRT